MKIFDVEGIEFDFDNYITQLVKGEKMQPELTLLFVSPLVAAEKWFKITTIVSSDKSDSIYAYLLFIEVTAQMMHRNLLSSLFEQLNIGLWSWNLLTGELVINEKWAEIIGYEKSELEPISIETWRKYAHPDDLITSNMLIDRYLKGKANGYSYELRMKHKKGHWVNVLDTGKIIAWCADGRPERIGGSHLELTEIKEIEGRHLQNLIFEKTIAEITALLSDPTAFNQNVNKAFEYLGSFTKASRVYYFGIDYNVQEMAKNQQKKPSSLFLLQQKYCPVRLLH